MKPHGDQRGAVAQRMLDDPLYFIESSFDIVDRYDKRVPFIPNPLQRHFYKNRSNLDIIVKPRRVGFSAIISAVLLHACETRENTRAVIISDDKDKTVRLFRRVQEYHNRSQFKSRLKVESTNEMSFPDTNSWFWIGTAGNRTFGRGDDITLAHCSEAAYFKDSSVITGIQEAMTKSEERWLVLETTANGAGTDFHKDFKKAINGESEWKGHFYGWWQDPQNVLEKFPAITSLDPEEMQLREAFGVSNAQLAWRRMKYRTMKDPSLFPQEFPATWEEAFLSSGAMIFDWVAIKRNEDTKWAPKWTGHIVDTGERIDIKADPRGPLEIYKTPERGAKYLIVADSALGVKGCAFSVGDVYDMRSWTQVAQWRGHTDPAEFGKILMRLGAFYGWALLAVENNYPGNATLDTVVSAEYPNIWDEPGEQGSEQGWKTTEKSKNQFISDGREALTNGDIKLNSEASLNESRTFIVAENGKMEPQSGCWQDCVIVFCKAANILRRVRYEEPETRKRRFKEIMGQPRRNRRSTTGGNYKSGVV